MRGFEQRTGSDGAFLFEVPVPSAERCSLYLAPDRFHGSFFLWFGGTDRGARPPLGEGVRDLGRIRLARTGAIMGRVTDGAGAPLDDVLMGIGPARGTTLGRFARSAADGSYLISHAPLGTYGVSTRLAGYVSQFREPLTVDADRNLGPVDFKLERALEISGRIVGRGG